MTGGSRPGSLPLCHYTPNLGPTPRSMLTPFWPSSGAQYVAEAEEKLQRARLLVESVRKEKVDLSNQLEEERRYVLAHPHPGRTFSLIPLKEDEEEGRFGNCRPRFQSCPCHHLAVSPWTGDMSSWASVFPSVK